MKKLFFTPILCVCAFFLTSEVDAQVEQGKFILGASSNLNFDFSTYNIKEDDISVGKEKISSFKISPSAAYLIADNLALGIILNYEYSSTSGDDADFKTSTFGIGPVARYYINLETVKPYVQGIYFYRSVSEGEHDLKNDSSSNAYALGAGAAIFFNDHISLDLGLDYNGILSKDSGSEYKSSIKRNSVVLKGGLSIYL